MAMGELRVALTDTPACGFDEVNITVVRARAHTSASADEADGGWHDLPVTPPRRVNLLDLTNGVLEELGQMSLPAGNYTQLRLVLQANAGASPGNSVLPTGGSEQPLATPSAAQSGIKLIHPFTVPAGGLADLVLDFDACKSIVRRGNGTYGLKPVIAAFPRVVAEIVGDVDPALNGTRISAQAGGNVLRATTPDATGAFKLAYLNPAAAASVDVVVTASGHASAVVGAVPIALQSSTRISTAGQPITLPLSASRSASGVVQPAAALPAVRALQSVGPIVAVEISSANADDTGAYALTLPVAAPVFASYATPLPLAFGAQAVAARYTLAASAEGFVTQSQAIDLASADATVNFTLFPAP